MLHSEVFLFLHVLNWWSPASRSVCQSQSISAERQWVHLDQTELKTLLQTDRQMDLLCEITIVQKGHFLLLLFHIKSNQVGNDMDELAVKQHTGNTVLCIVKVVGLESVKMKSSQSKNRHVRVNTSIICKHGIFSMAGQMTPCAQSRQLHCIDWWFSGSRFSPGK